MDMGYGTKSDPWPGQGHLKKQDRWDMSSGFRELKGTQLTEGDSKD